MSLAFLSGVIGVLLIFAYTLVYRYRHLSVKFNETKVDRVRRVIGKVAWLRVIVTSLLGGLFTYVLWHGVSSFV